MGKRYRNLIGRITAPETLRAAYRLTAQGKRMTAGFLQFKEEDAFNLDTLAREMADGTYAAGAPHEFFILDPKRRLISALPFRDRVAQQALCLVIGPIFDRALLPPVRGSDFVHQRRPLALVLGLVLAEQRLHAGGAGRHLGERAQRDNKGHHP